MRALLNTAWAKLFVQPASDPRLARVEAMSDVDPADRDLIRSVLPFTMTSPERVFHLIQSVRYLENNRIPGAIVECGVWRGGSMMTCAKTLVNMGSTSRDLHLFDTFEGMPPPEEVDKRFDGVAAKTILDEAPKSRDNNYWAISSIDEVRSNLASTGYPQSRTHFLKGRVEDTVPSMAPASIALLRLDTDWYSSTRHELEHLYPRLVSGGVLVIDDYGWWQGARKATDDFFRAQPLAPLLTRLDLDGRTCMKP